MQRKTIHSTIVRATIITAGTSALTTTDTNTTSNTTSTTTVVIIGPAWHLLQLPDVVGALRLLDALQRR